jgi:hypothetical protein
VAAQQGVAKLSLQSNLQNWPRISVRGFFSVVHIDIKAVFSLVLERQVV